MVYSHEIRATRPGTIGSALIVACADSPGPANDTAHDVVRTMLGKSRTRKRYAIAVATVLAAVLSLPEAAHARAHAETESLDNWPRTSAIIGNSESSVVEIVDAAEQDLADRGADVDGSAVELARWLGATMSISDTRVQAAHRVRILEFFMDRSHGNRRTFWAEFSLATFQQMAGDDAGAAGTLARALHLAESENVPSYVTAKTRGFMGHAQPSRPLSSTP